MKSFMRTVGAVTIVGAFAAFGFVASASSVGAQTPPGQPPTRAGQRGGTDQGRSQTAQREELERRFKERLDATVRARLHLTDEQAAKLREVASRTEEGRQKLRREEFMMRTQMRHELMAGPKADEAKVAALLDKLPQFERRRLELMESEQRELAKFLTPSQRGRYLGLQEELRFGMQEMQYRRLDSSRDSSRSGSPPGRRPPSGPPNPFRFF